MSSEKLPRRLSSGQVVRYHNCPDLPKQNLAEHQWGVAQVLLHMFPDIRVEVLRHALAHDMEEVVIGDIPAFTKMKLDMRKVEKDARVEIDKFASSADVYGDLLTVEEIAIIKCCDYMELYSYCQRFAYIRGAGTIASAGIGLVLKYADSLARENKNIVISQLNSLQDHYTRKN
jgi:5'-deoxynucleotidase YfbR-like HD superfamily hydrolase